MRADGLQRIELSDGRTVLRRGISKIVFDEAEVGPIVDRLVELLDGSRSREEIIAAFPEVLQSEVDELLDALVARRLVDVTASEAPPTRPSSNAFFSTFGFEAEAVRSQIERADIVLFGDNLISQSIVGNLTEIGFAQVKVVPIPVLDDEFASGRARVGDGGAATFAEPDLSGATLICATSDLGEADALLELNRLALAREVIFVPAWVADLVGYVGPLTYPFETACFRCYRLRADSNDPDHIVRSEIRRAATEDPTGRRSAGLIAPMADVVGAIAAMEILKAVVPFMPSDVVGRLVEINLVSFASVVRRVLKVPRCPDCSDVQRVPQVVLEHGPQIPY